MERTIYGNVLGTLADAATNALTSTLGSGRHFVLGFGTPPAFRKSFTFNVSPQSNGAWL